MYWRLSMLSLRLKFPPPCCSSHPPIILWHLNIESVFVTLCAEPACTVVAISWRVRNRCVCESVEPDSTEWPLIPTEKSPSYWRSSTCSYYTWYVYVWLLSYPIISGKLGTSPSFSTKKIKGTSSFSTKIKGISSLSYQKCPFGWQCIEPLWYVIQTKMAVSR